MLGTRIPPGVDSPPDGKQACEWTIFDLRGHTWLTQSGKISYWTKTENNKTRFGLLGAHNRPTGLLGRPSNAEPPALIGVSPTPKPPHSVVLNGKDRRGRDEVVLPDRVSLLVTPRLLNYAVLESDADSHVAPTIFLLLNAVRGVIPCDSEFSAVYDFAGASYTNKPALSDESTKNLQNCMRQGLPKTIRKRVIREMNECILKLTYGSGLPSDPMVPGTREKTDLKQRMGCTSGNGFGVLLLSAHLYQADPDFKGLWDNCHGGIFRDLCGGESVFIPR
ncbi:hypothetical protein Tco_0099656 [Tanacetum coccineum]